MTEIGYTADSYGAVSWSTFGLDEEDNPDLHFPASVAVYRRMRREETQLQSVLKAVKLPILRTDWRLDTRGVDPEVASFVSRNLGVPLDVEGEVGRPVRSRGRFSWHRHLNLALTSLDFGFAVFEQVYEYRADGRLWLKKLGYRPQGSINRIEVDRDGGLVSIEQHLGGKRGARMGVDRLVVYANEREGANWTGTSLLRASYKYWLLKDRLLRVQAVTVERNGLGVPVYEASPRLDDGSLSSEEMIAREEAEIAAGQKIASGLRAGEHSGASIPNGAKLTMNGVSGQLPDASKPIEYYDQQMAKSALAHFLTLGTQTGSWALGTTFADFFTMSLQTVAKDLAEVATAHIIEDLVDLNFGEDVPAPRLTFDEIGSQNPPTAQALQSLVQTGVIRPDDTLEDFMRRRHGLPEADHDTAREPGALNLPTEGHNDGTE